MTQRHDLIKSAGGTKHDMGISSPFMALPQLLKEVIWVLGKLSLRLSLSARTTAEEGIIIS